MIRIDQLIHSGADEFRNVAETARDTDFAKSFVLFNGETETNHAAA